MISARSTPVVSFMVSNIFAMTAGTLSATELTAPLPSPEPPMIVILSIWASGFAISAATWGMTLIIISAIAALLYFAYASAFFSMASASARPFALAASASASPLARIPAASASYFALIPAASFWRITSSASAFFSAAYLSASAFFSISAASSCCLTWTSFCFSSASRSTFAICAFTVAAWIVFCCS